MPPSFWSWVSWNLVRKKGAMPAGAPYDGWEGHTPRSPASACFASDVAGARPRRRLHVGDALVAAPLVTYAMRRRDVRGVDYRAAARRGPYLVDLEAHRMAGRERVVYRLAAQPARPSLRLEPGADLAARVAVRVAGLRRPWRAPGRLAQASRRCASRGRPPGTACTRLRRRRAGCRTSGNIPYPFATSVAFRHGDGEEHGVRHLRLVLGCYSA